LERKVIRRTDKLMFTTKSTQKMYVDKYNLEVSKTEVVYRGYEPTLYDEIKLSKELPEGIEKDKINIVHTGTIYKGLRDIRPLVNALNSLKATDRDTYNKINVIFVGQFTDPEDERLLSQVSCVKIINYVPFKVAMQYVVHADILLLYGNKNSTQVPGKVYEYIGSEAVIMTILGCEKDELNEIMKDMNKGPVLLNEELLITNELSKLVANFQNINGEWKQVCAKFQWINVVIDLQDKLFKH
jgi:hypothetical protein